MFVAKPRRDVVPMRIPSPRSSRHFPSGTPDVRIRHLVLDGAGELAHDDQLLDPEVDVVVVHARGPGVFFEPSGCAAWAVGAANFYADLRLRAGAPARTTAALAAFVEAEAAAGPSRCRHFGVRARSVMKGGGEDISPTDSPPCAHHGALSARRTGLGGMIRRVVGGGLLSFETETGAAPAQQLALFYRLHPRADGAGGGGRLDVGVASLCVAAAAQEATGGGPGSHLASPQIFARAGARRALRPPARGDERAHHAERSLHRG